MEIINPVGAGISKELEKSNVGYSANKKANTGFSWAITAAVLLLIGLVVPQVSIIFILIVCGISAYYTNSAKKDGANNLKKMKLAKIISTTVVVISIIIFIINILAVGVSGIPK